jgi:hypothetical protein
MDEIDDATWDRAREIFQRKHARFEAWSDTPRGSQQRLHGRNISEAPVATVIGDEARRRYVELAREELRSEAEGYPLQQSPRTAMK